MVVDDRTREGKPSITGDGGATRLVLAALLAVALAAGLAQAPAPALADEAQVNGVVAAEREAAALDCSDFATQRGAQATLARSPVSSVGDDAFELDEDGDGRACEAGPSGAAEDGTELGAQTGGDLDCVDLPSQAAAQARLKDNPSDPDGLDPENNGVACEFVPAPYADSALDEAPVAAARSGADVDCEDFEYQQEAQMVYSRDESDPNGLDGPNEPAEKNERFVGNGVACETMPVLASNVFDEAIKVEGAGAGGPEAAVPAALVAAWPRGGLALDLAALLLVASGVVALLTVWRARRSSGGSGR